MTEKQKSIVLSLVLEEKHKFSEHLKWLKSIKIGKNELPIKSTEKYIKELNQIIKDVA